MNVTPSGDDAILRFYDFLEHYRKEWGLATLQETAERVLFEWSEEGARQRVDNVLATLRQKGKPIVMHDHSEYVEGCYRCDLARNEGPTFSQWDDVTVILSGLAEVFREYPPYLFLSNVGTTTPGMIITISVPYPVAHELLAIVRRAGREQRNP